MINFCAPINNTTGYGITSTNIWRELRKLTNVSLFPIGGISIEDKKLEQDIINDVSNAMDGLSKDKPCLKIWHANDLFNRIGNNTYGALPFFELDTFKPPEVAALKHLDIVFTTCEWSKGVLIKNGIDENKIVICPLAVDHTVFNSGNIFNETKHTYRFINIGKWEIRKSHDMLVHAFNEAFTEDDDVELYMINHNPFLNAEQTHNWRSLYYNSKLGRKIKIFDRIGTHAELAHLIGQADCGVYISRAEGWNNEILETMAMNKPVIATNYSAHTAYCTNENSYLVDITELEPAHDNIWFDGTGNWAKFGAEQIKQTVEHMRYVYKNQIRTNQNGLETSYRYTWANTAKILHDSLLV